VPSRLGRQGAVPFTLGDVTGPLREEEVALAGDGDVISACTWPGDDFPGDAPSSWEWLLLRCFWEDVRGGGLGGRGDSLFFFFVLMPFLSPSRTVEFDDEDVRDSLTAARPCVSALIGSTSFGILAALLRVTGGLVRAGLACLARAGVGNRMGASRPGDCDDIEVGVVSRLYGPGPGESDHLVDGLPLKPLI